MKIGKVFLDLQLSSQIQFGSMTLEGAGLQELAIPSASPAIEPSGWR